MKYTIYFLGGALLVSPFFVTAYSPDTTHAALTQEIIKLFNEEFKNLKISDDDAEYIIQGSIDEDKDTRWLYHFYDPVYNRGLVLENKNIPDNPELALVAGGAKSRWQSSKEWAVNPQLQGGTNSFAAGIFKDYFSGENDFSWDRAIYEYAWGDKKRGLLALGQVIHLLEDASVPDHTRNDPHPPILDLGSPYEHWTKKFNRSSVDITIKDEPVLFDNLSEYFDNLANYSNNNFFSKDTVTQSEYSNPSVNYYIDGFGFTNTGTLPIVRRIQKFDGSIEYTLTDRNNRVLGHYWNLLSEQAVIHGAGMIKLFFNEVEEERRTKTLYNKNRSWVGKRWDVIKSFFGFSKTLPTTRNTTQFAGIVSALPETPAEEPAAIAGSDPAIATIVAVDAQQGLESTQLPSSSPLPPTPEPKPTPQTQPKPQTQSKPKNTSPLVPIIGSGGGPGPLPQEEENEKPEAPKDTTPPPPPVITSPANDGEIFATTTIIFKGTGEAEATISNSISTTTAQIGSDKNWNHALISLPQGTTTVTFTATDAAGNTSTTSSRIVFVDSTAPSVTLAVNECDQSLSSSTCLVATTTISLEWSTTASDLSHYELTCATKGTSCSGFSSATTTATSTVYTAPVDNQTYMFSAQTTDTNGNRSELITKKVEVVTRPIIINEIAWAGTGSSATTSKDEWVELFNPTAQIINLSGITLKSLTDSGPNIALSGSLAPLAYYLIERTDDNAVADVAASTTSSFGNGLKNSGEILALEFSGAIIDRTPEISSCGGWCGGSASSEYKTMERFDPLVSGTDLNNWSSWGGIRKNGTNIDGAAINGTPGERNSVNYLISLTGSLTTDKTLTKINSPYVINNSFSITGSTTLTIEPGVTIKFIGISSLSTTNGGVISAVGTATDTIVFTSWEDDAYAGDTNQNATSTTPAPGDWGAIRLFSDNSVFDNATIRYGGFQDVPGGTHWANIRATNASATIKNSIIEHSGTYGMWLKNSTSTIESNTIRNNNIHNNADSTGIISESGNSLITNNTFTNNIFGLQVISGDTSTVSNNTFTQNSDSALTINGSFPTLSGNSASGNGTNGIGYSGTLIHDYTFSADLPFVVSSFSVQNGATMTAAAGTIFKFSGASIGVSGKLLSNGTADKKVVFTSFKDDDCGISGGCGDTNGTTTTPALGDWSRIAFNSGAASSSLNHTIVRYGGGNSNAVLGTLQILNTSIDINNTTIEKNNFAGIWMQNSTSTLITNSIVRDHIDTTVEVMRGLMLLSSSTPTIANTTFSGNEENIFTDGTSSYTDGGGNSGL